MGLFNFLYKLTNIFSNKRKLKIFIVLGIILFLVFSWSRGVFASPSSEDSNSLMNLQLSLQESAMSYLRMLWKSGNYNSTTYNNLLNLMKYYNVYVSTSTANDSQFVIYLYFSNVDTGGRSYNSIDDFITDGVWSLGALSDGSTSGTEYPCKIAEFEGYSFTLYRPWVTGQDTIVNNNWTSFYLPDACWMVRSHTINELLSENGIYSEVIPTYSTHDEETEQVISSGFTSVNSSINNQTNTINNSINSATNSITNSVDNLTNTITDTSTDDSQVTFAQDTNQDLTSGFFTALYNSFETAFVDTSYSYIQFPIPFTNKKITFSSSYILDNVKRNQLFSVLVTLAESFWWFALGYFVILDIYKKINAIKSGDLTNIENDNITTDLL